MVHFLRLGRVRSGFCNLPSTKQSEASAVCSGDEHAHTTIQNATVLVLDQETITDDGFSCPAQRSCWRYLVPQAGASDGHPPRDGSAVHAGAGTQRDIPDEPVFGDGNLRRVAFDRQRTHAMCPDAISRLEPGRSLGVDDRGGQYTDGFVRPDGSARTIRPRARNPDSWRAFDRETDPSETKSRQAAPKSGYNHSRSTHSRG